VKSWVLFSQAHITRGSLGFVVVDAYTQYHWRGNRLKADYEPIRAVMKEIRLTFTGARIGYPCIGAGLAGGDWAIISEIINEELSALEHILVEYEV
jgi:O-acetyl-ADP-ribose deacetylase (regulator of RNase III)